MPALLPAYEMINLLFTVMAFVSLSAYVGAIHLLVGPVERQFYCTDRSIGYLAPYQREQSETVPNLVAATVGGFIVLATVVTMEAVRCLLKQPRRIISQSDSQYASCLCCCCPGKTAGTKSDCAVGCIAIIRVLLLFCFGALITEAFTVTLKKSVGRPRPHFLRACHLGPSELAACEAAGTSGLALPMQSSKCSKEPGKRKHLLEAMQSFPSGHASHSMYMTVFAALYLQCRFTFAKGHAVKWLLQCLALMWACFVCASRVSDYMHHSSDVVAGGLLGGTVGLIVCLYLRPSYLASCVAGVIEDRAVDVASTDANTNAA